MKDPGYAAERKVRFGIAWEASDHDGRIGSYVLIDRANGCKTAYRLWVFPDYSEDKIEARYGMFRNIQTGLNEREAQREQAETLHGEPAGG